MTRTPLFAFIARALRLAGHSLHTDQTVGEFVEHASGQRSMTRRQFAATSTAAASIAALEACMPRISRPDDRNRPVISRARLRHQCQAHGRIFGARMANGTSLERQRAHGSAVAADLGNESCAGRPVRNHHQFRRRGSRSGDWQGHSRRTGAASHCRSGAHFSGRLGCARGNEGGALPLAELSVDAWQLRRISAGTVDGNLRSRGGECGSAAFRGRALLAECAGFYGRRV